MIHVGEQLDHAFRQSCLPLYANEADRGCFCNMDGPRSLFGLNPRHTNMSHSNACTIDDH